MVWALLEIGDFDAHIECCVLRILDVLFDRQCCVRFFVLVYHRIDVEHNYDLTTMTYLALNFVSLVLRTI